MTNIDKQINTNNFDIARVILALIVFLGHFSALAQSEKWMWLQDYFSSWFAVKGFFVISGYLVYRSYCNSSSLAVYFQKRFLRIYPGYLVVIFCAVVAGAILTDNKFERYFDINLIKYIVYNALLVNFMQPTLQGVFENNYLSDVNGSLWTIKVEVGLYFFMPIIVVLMNKFKSRFILIVFYLIGVIWSYVFSEFMGQFKSMAYQTPGQLQYFCSGIFLSMSGGFLKKVKLWHVLLMIAFYNMNSGVARELLNPALMSLIVIYLTCYAFKKIDMDKIGDLSYGIYLYHFLIIQIVVSLGFVEESPYWGFLLSLAFVLLLSWLSWNFVEKKFIKR